MKLEAHEFLMKKCPDNYVIFHRDRILSFKAILSTTLSNSGTMQVGLVEWSQRTRKFYQAMSGNIGGVN